MLPWPANSEVTFNYIEVKLPPARLSKAESQAGKLRIPIFTLFVSIQSNIKSEYIVSVADAN